MRAKSNALKIIFLGALGLFAAKGFSVCIDTLSTYTCHDGNPDWGYYDTNNPSGLWSINTCAGVGLNDCTCGDTDPGSPCDGCPQQSNRTAGNCYSDASCSVPCTPVPQFSSFTWPMTLFLSLGIAFYFRRGRAKSVA